MAASTQGIRAGRAFVELFADDSRLVRGLRRAEKRLRAFGDRIRNFGLKLAGVVSAAVAPLGLLAIRAASDAQESLSRFEAVFKDQAKAAGQFADALAQSVGRSKIEIRDALATFQSFFVGLGFGGSESRKLSQTLQSLALDFASFHNLTDDEAVGRFISALSGSGEVLDRFGINIKQAALEQELLRMGIRKSWTEVTEQEKALARLNIIMGAMGDQGAVGDAVRTAGSFANQMKRLRGQLRDTAVEIGQALLPVVTPLVTKAAEVAKRFGQWISENRQLVATVFKVAAAVAAAGVALVVLGTLISGIGMVMGTLATIVTGVGTALGLLSSALGLLLSSIGLVVAAVGTLGVVLLKTSGVGTQALAWLGERFEALKATALRAWRGIADALAAGDIALAARVLWMALRVQWLKGVQYLKGLWLGFKTNFLRVATESFYGAVKVAAGAWAGLRAAWVQTVAFLKKAWTTFTATLASAHRVAVGFVERQLHRLRGAFDETYDVEAAIAISQSSQRADLQRIEGDKQSDLASSEQQRQQQLAAIGQAFEDTAEALDQAAADATERQRQAAQAEMNAAVADLEQARREYQAALDEAARKRAASDAAGTEGGPGSMESLLDQIQGLGASLSAAAERTISARGTFNAAAIQGLQASNLDERIAEASETTAANTSRLVRDSRRQNAPVFT